MTEADDGHGAIAEVAEAGSEDLGAARGKTTREDADQAFLVELGQRVRRIRALRGMSRKVLAKVSGISERYIAQLESGQGNVSIMLLRRVAEATGAPLEDLVGEAGENSDWQLVRDLLRAADPALIAEVKALLSGERLPSGPRAVAESHIAVEIGRAHV